MGILKKIEKFPKISKDFGFFTIDLEKFGMDLEKFRFDGQNAQVITCAFLRNNNRYAFCREIVKSAQEKPCANLIMWIQGVGFSVERGA